MKVFYQPKSNVPCLGMSEVVTFSRSQVMAAWLRLVVSDTEVERLSSVC